MSGIKVHTMAEYLAKGEAPDLLFWVGCAGSFDDRAKKITKAKNTHKESSHQRC